MFENPVLLITLTVLAGIAIAIYARSSNRKAKEGSVLYAVAAPNDSSSYGIRAERWLLAYRSRRGNVRHNGQRYRLCYDMGIRRGKPTVAVTARDGRTITHRRSRQNLTAFPPNTALEMV
ncbi:MAG: hypothetical protein Q7R86_02950 [bacterium]|nr:hypothetical protein [bacterium]